LRSERFYLGGPNVCTYKKEHLRAIKRKLRILVELSLNFNHQQVNFLTCYIHLKILYYLWVRNHQNKNSHAMGDFSPIAWLFLF